ncbi:MAG: hypothetical protein HQL82_03885 [Magnetococcales bacterium]|nr:hypothetical protein [Magnetococcales bacterium]
MGYHKKAASRSWVRPVCLGAALLLTLSSTTQAASREDSGSCANQDFTPFYQGKTLQWTGLVRSTRGAAQVQAGLDDARVVGQLGFSQPAEVLAESGNRIQVRAFKFQNHEPVEGWVKKSDLLCRNLPIKGEGGLEVKFFIRTSTAPRQEDGTDPAVRVFQNPELSECVGGSDNCREGASRFHMYFVFDQQGDAVLLADRYRLEEEDLLLGWVSLSNGFQWNNAYSLRPREDLTAPEDGGPGTVCSYEHLKDAVARNAKACHPVVGGVNWFKSPLRIPVLDMVDEEGRHVAPEDQSADQKKRRFYKVALARPGLVGRPVGEGKFAISPGLAQQIMPEMKALSAKKNVDIFFLLDATASMDPVIDAVRGTAQQRGVIQEIIHSLKNTPSFKETQFRFGFRVYRDPYADKLVTSGLGDGVGEGHPLPATCEMSTEQQTEAYLAFQQAISGVQVTTDDQDDYEENLYGGLNQVLKSDIAACPDHLKVLFVIGDNGFRSGVTLTNARGRSVTKSKYRQAIGQDNLIRLLRGGDREGEKANSVVPFIIQTPARADKAKHAQLYHQAYRLFEEQSRVLLQQSLPSDSRVEEHFFRMDEAQLVPRLVATVERFGGSSLINEIILDIRGGAALNRVIDRLRRERVDIPGVYWHILSKGACGNLGDQCQRRVYDTTLMGYMEADDQVVEELWVSSSALSSWIRILKGFEGYYELPEPQLRRALISALILGLQQEIRRPPIDVAGETPAEYAQRRGGLPVRRHSPLLSYQVPALSAQYVTRDKNQQLIVVDQRKQPLTDRHGQPIQAIPVCELRRLALWAIKSKEILEVIERDNNRPVYQSQPYQSFQCPDASENGKALPRITSPIQAEPLGPDPEYRYSHTIGGHKGYWIPQEFLP